MATKGPPPGALFGAGLRKGGDASVFRGQSFVLELRRKELRPRLCAEGSSSFGLFEARWCPTSPNISAA